MIYPNTQPSGVLGGGGQDNKKRLQQLLSRTGAFPLFGGVGRSASVEDLPTVGAPSLSFNPFLKMLAGRPGENFDNLPQGVAGGFAGGLPPGIQSIQGNPGNPNAPQPGQQGFSGAPAASPSGNPFDNSYAGSLGHFNDTRAGAAPVPAQVPGMNSQAPPTGVPVGINNPLYHTLLQLAMYGQDR